MRSFSGAWPALLTPFTKDDQVNVSALKDFTAYLLTKNVSGFYLCGSTGQGIFMSPAERKLVAETVSQAVNGRVPIIVHIGSQVLSDAQDLARHAQDLGVDGISSIIPAGYTDLDSISAYFRRVAETVSTLPFLPYLFGTYTDPVTLVKTLQDVPNLAGTKYTGPNMYQFRQLREARSGQWSVFSGMDEQCLFAAMAGSCGNIGSTLNVMPGIYQKIHQAYQTGDLRQGRDLQLRANYVTEVLISFGFFGSLSATVASFGIDYGSPRLPAFALPKERLDPLRQALDAVDFAEIAQM